MPRAPDKLGQNKLLKDIDTIRTMLGLPVFLNPPYTSASWDGDAKTAADSGLIDLSAVFSVPAGVRAVYATLSLRDGTVNVAGRIGPDAADDNAIASRTQTADQYDANSGLVPCDANGDIYFTATGDLDNVYLEIWGWWP